MTEELPPIDSERAEHDAIDQVTPADPDEDAVGLPEDSGPDGLVNDADWLDQQREVPLADDREAGDPASD